MQTSRLVLFLFCSHNSTGFRKRKSGIGRATRLYDAYRAVILDPAAADKRSSFSHKALRQAHRWLDELLTDSKQTIEWIAARESRTERSIRMTVSLAFLSPDLVKAAIDGRLLRGLGLTRLIDPPIVWSDQRLLGETEGSLRHETVKSPWETRPRSANPQNRRRFSNPPSSCQSGATGWWRWQSAQTGLGPQIPCYRVYDQRALWSARRRAATTGRTES
jgi:hypothetical protein